MLLSLALGAGIVWFFMLLLRVLTPGTPQSARHIFGAFCAFSPQFIYSVVHEDVKALVQLLWVLLAVWGIALAAKWPHTAWARRSMLLLWLLTGWLWYAYGEGLEWSLQHFFVQAVNTAWPLPNAIFAFAPLFHPAFGLPLWGLSPLVMRTDAHTPEKHFLIAAALLYVGLMAGLPLRQSADFLPFYGIILCLLFPAWDRFFSYGHYFFRRLTLALLVFAFGWQVTAALWLLAQG